MVEYELLYVPVHHKSTASMASMARTDRQTDTKDEPAGRQSNKKKRSYACMFVWGFQNPPPPQHTHTRGEEGCAVCR